MATCRSMRFLLVAALLVGSGRIAARADAGAILKDIEAFFSKANVERRRELCARIAADPAYDRAKVRGWLHKADLFKPHAAGQMHLDVPLHDGSTRALTLRIPQDYDPHKAWPLVYALHGSGGSGPDIIRYVEHVLGADVEQYVVAAPTGYGEAIVHDPAWPPNGEHAAALLAVRKTVHIDSDRIYLVGYSMGGHATWTVGIFYADQFAGMMPVAGTFTLLVFDQLWDAFLPNLANTYVLGAWGANDTQGEGGEKSPQGGIAGLNRKLRNAAAKLGLPFVMWEDAEKGHGGIVAPAEERQKFFAQCRAHYPAKFQHTFRHLCQGQAYWLEAHRWYGDQWESKLPTIHMADGENSMKDEDMEKAVARTCRQLLARLGGEIKGQELRVERKKVTELTVWVGDDMINWDEPVVLIENGRKSFEGKLTPDLYVCLSQAARTWDFDRLRWAGLRCHSGEKTRVVTAETVFPSPFEEAKKAGKPAPKKR